LVGTAGDFNEAHKPNRRFSWPYREPTAAKLLKLGSSCESRVSQAVAERHPDAAVITPPRVGAVASASAETAPTQRDRHLRMIAERGRMAWQKASGYNLRAKVEASIGRYKRVVGDALRSRTDRTEATEVAIAAAALNRMLAFGRPNYVRIA
jgi:hypothetical protein